MVLNKDYLYPLDLHQMQISKEASRHPLLPYLNMTTHQVGGHGEQFSKANEFRGIPNATQDFVTATDFVIYILNLSSHGLYVTVCTSADDHPNTLSKDN